MNLIGHHGEMKMKARNVDSDTFVMISLDQNLQRHYKNGLEVTLVESEDADGYCVINWGDDQFRILREFLPGAGSDYTEA